MSLGFRLKPQPTEDLERCAGTIHKRFEAQAQKTPDATAVTFLDRGLSYGELNRRANQLARTLQKAGVGPEIPVALYLERSVEMLISILAVLKAGGAYVPIELAYPAERAAFMMSDTEAPVLLTQSKLAERITSPAARTICVDSDWPSIAIESDENLATPVLDSNMAYIIYTSGSTGTPKGVVVTHNNVVRLLEQTNPWYLFGPSDVWSMFHSCAFDVSVYEMWGALFYGGRLVVVPYMVSRTPSEFYKLLSTEGVTVLSQTPSAFRQLIWTENETAEKLPLKLRYVICAGEALELQSLAPWFEQHGDESPLVVNMYGITETTVHSMYRPIHKADLASGVGSVIGVPIPDLQIHLLDEDLKPVPSGTPGEICVGGGGVARGYWNRPELTARRFIPDPFSTQPEARLYRSGDLAQINSQGEMEYLGRMDHQVKIRGFRVELGEIQSALNQHPALRESAVMATEGSDGMKHLVAYVVSRNGTPTVTDLREHLGQKLPEYMVPGHFMFLESLPLTTNGKLDRRGLPAPDHARPALKESFTAPSTENERILAGIWSNVLELEQVGTHDNFFELGGDSIRSIAVLAGAARAGLHLTLQQLFQHPTIAALAAQANLASEPIKTTFSEPFSLISAGDRRLLPDSAEDAYPLSRLQLGMFYHNELDPESAIYHDVFSYRVGAPFDSDKLGQALQQLVARHPVLRTSFHLAGFSEPLQIVHQDVRAPLTVEDLRHLSASEQTQHLRNWVEQEKRNAFDRTEAPLIRFHVLQYSDSDFQLILSFHHSCLDGWSLAAVVTEILQDYVHLLQGQATDSPNPQVTYRDFIALEMEACRSGAARLFWSAQLEGATSCKLPRWPKHLCEGGHEQKRGPEVVVPREVADGLRRLAHSAGVPLKTVLLAAHQRVMGFLCGQNDVVSGLVCNGRPENVDGERLIGLFLNSLPFRLQLKPGASWLSLVEETFALERDVIPYRRFPLAEIQKLNGPVFETAFDFVHFHVFTELKNCGALEFSEGHYFEANNLATYTTFMLDSSSSELSLHIDYDPTLIPRELVERLTTYYQNTLQAMASNPRAGYLSFSPLAESERCELLDLRNATSEPLPEPAAIYDLFEAQVRERPNSVALVCDGKELTYAQLNDQAISLATSLGQAGVKPNDLVGICAERSAAMISGLLGILRAGAAYVPLDPAHPAERLHQLIADAGLSLVIAAKRQAPLLPASVRVMDLDTSAPSGQAEPSQSGNRAYVIFTSGSTGKPKAVQVNQRAVVNVLADMRKRLGFGPSDNLLAITTLSFDIAALEIFLPLVCGSRLTLATQAESTDPARLIGLLEESQPTLLQATPTTWKMLIEAGWQGNKRLRALCGGESLNRELADLLLARTRELWNVYGPTETTIWSAAWKVTAGESVPIGQPLANTSLYVLDQYLQLVPVGAVGELCIGGIGLSDGYLNQPELTAERFVANPFAPRERMYKTGDLARYLPDGNIECLGRKDDQVKVRGFRIEPGEIEAALRGHPLIRDALVAARPNQQREPALVAYLLWKNGSTDISAVRDYLAARLPVYMVPQRFMTLQALPLTANGKADRQRLPSPDPNSQPRQNFVPPEGRDQEQLADIWKEVLGLNRVGIHDNFFEMGGDSLSATRAFARINRALGVKLSLRHIFEHPTISALASLLGQNGNGAVRTASRPIMPRRRGFGAGKAQRHAVGTSQPGL